MASDAPLPANSAKRLSDLGLDLASYPGSYPAVNTIDIYRIYLTSVLHKATGAAEDIIYPALQWTQTLDKGDLNLAVPRLRVKGSPPAEQAQEWAAKVGRDHLRRLRPIATAKLTDDSSLKMILSCLQLPVE